MTLVTTPQASQKSRFATLLLLLQPTRKSFTPLGGRKFGSQMMSPSIDKEYR
jgi:hypothetical protein